MTKERRLAILMWEEIARRLESFPDENVDVLEVKRDFCAKHGLKWRCDCWFCEYMKQCKKCPLSYQDGNMLYRGCSNYDDGLYTRALFGDRRERIRAASKIQDALEGKR